MDWQGKLQELTTGVAVEMCGKSLERWKKKKKNCLFRTWSSNITRYDQYIVTRLPSNISTTAMQLLAMWSQRERERERERE